MKKALLLLLAMGQFTLFAQDFTGQHNGYVHFYKPVSSNLVDMVRCDSTDVSGTDSIYWFRTGVRDVWGDGITSPSCMFWGGPECLYLRDVAGPLGPHVTAANRFIQFYNYLGDSITMDLHLAMGDSTLVFEDGFQRVRIKLTAAAPTTSFSVSDSLLTFTFSHTDLSDLPIASSLHGSAITFSKLYGMMNGYAMDSFPHVLRPIELLGVRGPNVGFHGLSMANVYDFQVGDWYETHTYMGGGPPHNNYHRYTMISRTDFTDRVEYSVREDHQTLSIIGPPPYPYEYSSDTTVKIQYKNIFMDEAPVSYGFKPYERYFVDSLILDCSASPYSYFYQINQCMNECPGTTCIGGGDCFMSYKYDVKYSAGAGLIELTSQLIPSFANYGYEKLIYLNANGMECGEATLSANNTFSSAMVQVYPNPANDQVTIETGNLGSFVQSVFVADLAGKKVQAPLAVDGSRITLNLSGMKAGTYWMGIETTQGLLTKKLVIIH